MYSFWIPEASLFLHPADEDNWNDLLRNGFTYGGGTAQSEDFFKAVDRRIERTLMRTVSNFYFIVACTRKSCSVNYLFTIPLLLGLSQIRV
jgi:hypothetical protein